MRPPQRQADKGPGLHNGLQGLDMFPMEGIHEEVWEELCGQKLQSRTDQGIFPWPGAFQPGPGVWVGSGHSSWLCFRRNPLETAKEQSIHIKPNRSTSKTISQPFREIYSGLRSLLWQECMPQLDHITLRPQGHKVIILSLPDSEQASHKYQWGGKGTTSYFSSIHCFASFMSHLEVGNKKPESSFQSLWVEYVRPSLGALNLWEEEGHGTHTPSILSYP